MTRRVHDELIRVIGDGLHSGRLRAGDRLPAERELADELGMSRASVREGLRVLEALGVVRSGVGSGPDAGTRLVGAPEIGLSVALKLHTAGRHLEIHDLIEVRRMLETTAVGSGRATAEVVERLDDLLHLMDAPRIVPDEFHRLDAEFHLVLVTSHGNGVMTAAMAGIRGAIERYVLDAVATIDDWERERRRLQREHRAIAAAVRAGDGTTASVAVVRHIDGFVRRVGLVEVASRTA